MIDHQALQLAVRTQLATLEVATTGSTSLGVASGVYSRSSGSFLTDGFKPGMEITPSSFGTSNNNTVCVITAVSALTLSVNRTLTTETEGAGKTIAAKAPSSFAAENIPFQPVAGVPWIEEQLLSGPTQQITLGEFGWIEHDPLYVLQVHVPEGTGVGAANAYADGIIELFAPRTALTLSNGDVARVRTRPGPFRSQLRNFVTGYATVAVNVPLRIHTVNII
jgi:hypothetical protein